MRSSPCPKRLRSPVSNACRISATALRRHPGMQRIRVLGAGLEARDREAVRGYAVTFVPNAVEAWTDRTRRARACHRGRYVPRRRPRARSARRNCGIARSCWLARGSCCADRRRPLHVERDHARRRAPRSSPCACAMRASASSKTSRCRWRSMRNPRRACCCSPARPAPRSSTCVAGRAMRGSRCRRKCRSAVVRNSAMRRSR